MIWISEDNREIQGGVAANEILVSSGMLVSGTTSHREVSSET